MLNNEIEKALQCITLQGFLKRWCPSPDSNRDDRRSLPPQDSVSTNFTTWAHLNFHSAALSLA